MPDFKFGDQIRITINRRGKPEPKKAPAREKRYGAIRRIEDPTDKPVKGELQVVLLDLSTLFIQQPIPSFGDHQREFFRFDQDRTLTLDSDTNPDYRATVQATLATRSLEADIDVLDRTDSTIYRQSYQVWPLPFLHSVDYGLSFHFGATDQIISSVNNKWKERLSPTERIAKLEAASSDHSAEIALIEHEEAEWAAPFTLFDPTVISSQNFWHILFVDWWRNYAALKLKKLSSAAKYSVDFIGTFPVFEPFDPWDTDNYKVTMGGFDDDEVEPPKIRKAQGAELITIGLMPVWWDYVIAGTQWGYDRGITHSGFWKRTFTDHGSIVGYPSPIADERDSNYPGVFNEYVVRTTAMGPDGLLDPPFNDFTDTTVQSDGLPTTAEVSAAGSPYSSQRVNQIVAGLAMQGHGTTNQVFSGDFPSSPGYNIETVEVTNSSLTITIADTPVGALVGRVFYKKLNQSFFIYRKTAVERGQSVYDGPYDGLSYTCYPINGSVFNLYCMPVNSQNRSFTDFDPNDDNEHHEV